MPFVVVHRPKAEFRGLEAAALVIHLIVTVVEEPLSRLLFTADSKSRISVKICGVILFISTIGTSCLRANKYREIC
jgi:hypothetical protein